MGRSGGIPWPCLCPRYFQLRTEPKKARSQWQRGTAVVFPNFLVFASCANRGVVADRPSPPRVFEYMTPTKQEQPSVVPNKWFNPDSPPGRLPGRLS